MAEVEYKGIKVGGSKLLLIIPLIGTIVGGLWGGFEVYQRYLEMEAKIAKFVTPDLSGFDKRISLIEEKFAIVDTHMTFVSKEIDLFKEEIGMIKEINDEHYQTIKDLKASITFPTSAYKFCERSRILPQVIATYTNTGIREANPAA